MNESPTTTTTQPTRHTKSLISSAHTYGDQPPMYIHFLGPQISCQSKHGVGGVLSLLSRRSTSCSFWGCTLKGRAHPDGLPRNWDGMACAREGKLALLLLDAERYPTCSFDSSEGGMGVARDGVVLICIFIIGMQIDGSNNTWLRTTTCTRSCHLQAVCLLRVGILKSLRATVVPAVMILVLISSSPCRIVQHLIARGPAGDDAIFEVFGEHQFASTGHA